MRSGQALRIAVLASGRGSNFEALQRAIEAGQVNGRIVVLLSDKEGAPVLDKAAAKGIAAHHVNPASFGAKSDYEQELARRCAQAGAELVVLAGYMRVVGKSFLDHYAMRVINIHPSLLPSFPGLHAQRQAVEYGVRYSGCTVHFVDSGVDTGPILLQQVVPVLPEDDEDTLAERILAEEHRLLPRAVQLIADGKVVVKGRKVSVLE